MDGASSFYQTAAAAEMLSFEDEPSAASVDASVLSFEVAGPFEEHFGAVAAIESGLHAFVAEFVALSSWYYP